MPVLTRRQARNPRRSALLIGSDYQGQHIIPTNCAVNDTYYIRNCLLEQAKFEARDITVWTDQLPTGVFANPDYSITYVTEEMVVSHLTTLVAKGYSRPGDSVLFFLSGHRAYGQTPRVILGKNSYGRTVTLRAASLKRVVHSVAVGVFFTVIVNSCGSPAMAEWSKFQFPFVYVPFLHREQTQHTPSDLVVTLTSSCAPDERSYGLKHFEPFQTGISYFALALVKVLERQNGPITHAQLIQAISDFLINFKNRMVIEQGLSDQFTSNSRHHPSLLCADSQLEATFLQL